MISIETALLKQTDSIRRWVVELPVEAWDGASILSGWSIHGLVCHIAIVQESLLSALSRSSDNAPLRIGEYVSSYSGYADQLEDSAQQRTLSLPVPDLASHFDDLQESLDQAFAHPSPAVIQSTRGSISYGDFLRSRMVEFVVHSDDLTRSLPQLKGPTINPDALGVAVSCLLEARAHQCPGTVQTIDVAGVGSITCGGTPGSFSLEAMEFLRFFSGRIPVSSLSSGSFDSDWVAVLS